MHIDNNPPDDNELDTNGGDSPEVEETPWVQGPTQPDGEFDNSES